MKTLTKLALAIKKVKRRRSHAEQRGQSLKHMKTTKLILATLALAATSISAHAQYCQPYQRPQYFNTTPVVPSQLANAGIGVPHTMYEVRPQPFGGGYNVYQNGQQIQSIRRQPFGGGYTIDSW
jgi:hypothetical protein